MSGSTTADINIKVAVVDRAPQQNRETEQIKETLVQHQNHRDKLSTL